MPDEPLRWALILHGGAKEIQPEKAEAHRRGCLRALQDGRQVLERGGPAVDAVEAAIRVLEADETFNAGRGSARNADGEVEMCAGLMDGGSFEVGAVGAIMGVHHPISVAKLLMPAETILLVGEGARRFAAEHGAELCDPRELITGEPSLGADTVGCVALDCTGNIVAGTSTGGMDGAPAGRVGDSPLPGCGFYADSEVGGASLSGDGERIARMTLASKVMQNLAALGPQGAAERALASLNAVGGEAGAIVLDSRGGIGWAHNSPHFAVAFVTSEAATPRVHLSKADENRDG
jgi:L-asparaginase / beta-aspartyl-peptidase